MCITTRANAPGYCLTSLRDSNKQSRPHGACCRPKLPSTQMKKPSRHFIRCFTLATVLAVAVFAVAGSSLASSSSPESLPESSSTAAAAKPMGKVCIDGDCIERVVLVNEDTTESTIRMTSFDILPQRTTTLPAGEYVLQHLTLKGGCYLAGGVDEQTGISFEIEKERFTILPDQLLTLDLATLKIRPPFHWKVFASHHGPDVRFQRIVFDSQGHSFSKRLNSSSQLTVSHNGRQVGVGSPEYG